MVTERGAHTVQIVLALIGLASALGGALIANWEKVFGTPAESGPAKASRQEARSVPPAGEAARPSAEPRPSGEAPPQRTSRGPDISGTWRDSTGAVFTVVQQGNTFRFTSSGPAGTTSGTGTVTGNRFQSRYQSNAPSWGQCAGDISEDGRTISGGCADSVYGQYGLSMFR